MAYDVIGRHRRTGKDELPGRAAIVDGAAHMVPDRGLDLPLVQEAGNGSLQHQGRVHGEGAPCVLVAVQQDFTGSHLTGGGGLPARLYPLNDNGAAGVEAVHQLSVCNSCSVGHLQSVISTWTKLLLTKKQGSQQHYSNLVSNRKASPDGADVPEPP